MIAFALITWHKDINIVFSLLSWSLSDRSLIMSITFWFGRGSERVYGNAYICFMLNTVLLSMWQMMRAIAIKIQKIKMQSVVKTGLCTLSSMKSVWILFISTKGNRQVVSITNLNILFFYWSTLVLVSGDRRKTRSSKKYK